MLICNEVESSDGWSQVIETNLRTNRGWSCSKVSFYRGSAQVGSGLCSTQSGQSFWVRADGLSRREMDTQCAEWTTGTTWVWPCRSPPPGAAGGPLLSLEGCSVTTCSTYSAALSGRPGQPLPDLTPKFCWPLPALQSAPPAIWDSEWQWYRRVWYPGSLWEPRRLNHI